MVLMVFSGDGIDIGFVGGMEMSGDNARGKGLGHPRGGIGLYW